MDLKKPTCREVPLRVGFEIHVSPAMRRTSSMTEAAKRNALAEALGSCAKRGGRSMLSALSLFYFRTLVEAEHILTRAPSWSKARLESRRQSSDACFVGKGAPSVT